MLSQKKRQRNQRKSRVCRCTRVENENVREFYMQEAVKAQWGTRQLERQIKASL